MTDGVDHINIYSKGKTKLGKFLTNFEKYNISIPDDGDFESIEGYWYWLTRQDDQLRNLYGFQAKKVGKSLPKVKEYTDKDFKTKIRHACWIKLITSQYVDEFRNSKLPFKHYYVYGDKIVEAGYEWIVDMWTKYRKYLNDGKV